MASRYFFLVEYQIPEFHIQRRPCYNVTTRRQKQTFDF